MRCLSHHADAITQTARLQIVPFTPGEWDSAQNDRLPAWLIRTETRLLLLLTLFTLTRDCRCRKYTHLCPTHTTHRSKQPTLIRSLVSGTARLAVDVQ